MTARAGSPVIVRFPPLAPTKTLSRIAILAAAIGAFVTLRVDRFLGIAIETDWLPDYQRADRIRSNDTEWCTTNECLRLPAEWIWISILVGLVTTGLVLLALWRARAYFDATSCAAEKRKQTLDAVKKEQLDVAARSTIVLLWTLWAMVAAAGIGVAVLRFLVSHEHVGLVWLTAIGVLQFLLVIVSVIILARVVASRGRKDVDWKALASVVRRQRATIVIVVLFAALVLFLPIAADQIADALRALTLDSTVGWTNVLFVVAAASLLSAAVLEAWRATERRAAVTPPRARTTIRFWVALIVGGGLLGLGIWAGLSGGTGGGLAAVGGVVIVYGLLEIGTGTRPSDLDEMNDDCGPVTRSGGAEAVNPLEPPTTEDAPLSSHASAAARYVAVIPLAALAVALVGALVEMAILEHPQPGQWLGPLVLAVLLGAMAVLVTRTLKDAEPVTAENERGMSRPQRVADVITIALNAVTILLLVFVRTPEAALVAAAAAAASFGLHLVLISLRERDPRAIPSRLPERARDSKLVRFLAGSGGTIVFAYGGAILVVAGVHLSPLTVSRELGSIALVLVFVAGLIAAGFTLSWLGGRYHAPRTLEWFGLRQLPVFTGLVILWVAAGLLAPVNLHDVRVTDRTSADQADDVTLESAFDQWRSEQPESRSSDPATGPVPLVVVASHGGGIRAAYWTAVVMDCVVGAGPAGGTVEDEAAETVKACDTSRRHADSLESARRIFLASGVSGGAVGLAAYSQQLLAEDQLTDDWIERRMTDDLLAPVIGWALFHDVPNHLVGLNPLDGGGCRIPLVNSCVTQDRAAILEQAIEGADGGDRLLRSTWDARVAVGTGELDATSAVPLLVFNSSTTGRPHRAVTSAANLADWPLVPSKVGDPDDAAAHPVSDAADTLDLLCGDQDLRISTASTLAARFPYISPSGVMHGNCDDAKDADITDEQRCQTSDTCLLQLSDGGDLENSGLMTIAELLPALEALVKENNEGESRPDIAIVVIDIDNDYRDLGAKPATPELARESLLPVQIILSGAAAMQDAAYGLVQKQVADGCFITIAPERQPGIQAPLGWALSESSRLNLRTSIVADAEQVKNVKLLQRWLTPGGVPSGAGLDKCVPD